MGTSCSKGYDCCCCPRKGVIHEQQERYRNTDNNADHPEYITSISLSEPETDVEEIGDTKILLKVRVLYNLEKGNEGDLEIKKGETLLIRSKLTDDWIMAENSVTNKTGYIPGSYVRLINDEVKNLDAYFEIDRITAEKMLFLPDRENGTFIIRPRGDGRGYALSVLHSSLEKKTVDHYKINQSKPTDPTVAVRYFFDDKKGCETIADLIGFFTEAKDLNLKLTVPCSRDFKPPINFRSFEIDRESIEIGAEIGKGEFGTVYEATWNKQLKVAVKKSHEGTQPGKFMQEARIMAQVHHPNVVQLMGICTEPSDEPVLIIMELLPKGSLLHYIKHNEEGRSMTFEMQMHCVNQVASGMAYLEKKRIIHLDLRAANVLVDRDDTMKVADFGIGFFMGPLNTKSHSVQSPYRWTAPEAAIDNIFSLKSDVWSYGVLLYEVFSRGKKPYEGMIIEDIPRNVRDKGYRLPNPIPNDRNGSVIYALMMRCWDLNPVNRPSFKKIRHELMTSMYASGDI